MPGAHLYIFSSIRASQHTSCCKICDRLSTTNRDRQGDNGSPCYKPWDGQKGFKRTLFRRIEYQTLITHHYPFTMKAQPLKNTFQITPIHSVVSLSEVQFISSKFFACFVSVSDGMKTLKNNQGIMHDHTS